MQENDRRQLGSRNMTAGFYSIIKGTIMTNVTYYRVAGDPDAQATSFIQKICIHCDDQVFFLMTQDQYDQWVIDKKYIQDVFPHLDRDIREWMISGTHPKCWDEMFPEEDLD